MYYPLLLLFLVVVLMCCVCYELMFNDDTGIVRCVDTRQSPLTQPHLMTYPSFGQWVLNSYTSLPLSCCPSTFPPLRYQEARDKPGWMGFPGKLLN